MNHDTNWKLLQHLAEEKRDAAARALAGLIRERNAAGDKLQLLVDYRQDYHARFDAAQRQGIDGERLRNFRAFLANLERAIEQQTDIMASAQERVETAQSAWQVEARTAQSFRVLDDRQTAEAAQLDRRHQQRLQDEFASRMKMGFRDGGDD